MGLSRLETTIQEVERWIEEEDTAPAEESIAPDLWTLIHAARDLRAVVERFMPELQRSANGEPVYGYYPGGDPRLFTPDAESCTPAEIEAHREACAAWDRGERPDPGGPHRSIEGEERIDRNGKPFICGPGSHDTRAHYGVGTYVIVDPGAVELLEQAQRALGGGT